MNQPITDKEARLPTKREAAERYVNEQLAIMHKYGSLHRLLTPEEHEKMVQQ